MDGFALLAFFGLEEGVAGPLSGLAFMGGASRGVATPVVVLFDRPNSATPNASA